MIQFTSGAISELSISFFAHAISVEKVLFKYWEYKGRFQLSLGDLMNTDGYLQSLIFILVLIANVQNYIFMFVFSELPPTVGIRAVADECTYFQIARYLIKSKNGLD